MLYIICVLYNSLLNILWTLDFKYILLLFKSFVLLDTDFFLQNQVIVLFYLLSNGNNAKAVENMREHVNLTISNYFELSYDIIL